VTTTDLYSYEENQQQSPLLRLPAEIRTEIYKYALSNNEIIVTTTPLESERAKVSYEPYTGYKSFVSKGLCSTFYLATMHRDASGAQHTSTGIFSMSAVCRQLHFETYLMEFKLNCWTFRSTGILKFWITRTTMPLYLAKLIPVLGVTERPWDCFPRIAFWRMFPGLTMIKYRTIVTKWPMTINIDTKMSLHEKIEKINHRRLYVSYLDSHRLPQCDIITCYNYGHLEDSGHGEMVPKKIAVCSECTARKQRQADAEGAATRVQIPGLNEPPP
jgi:hypothetical protein